MCAPITRVRPIEFWEKNSPGVFRYDLFQWGWLGWTGVCRTRTAFLWRAGPTKAGPHRPASQRQVKAQPPSRISLRVPTRLSPPPSPSSTSPPSPSHGSNSLGFRSLLLLPWRRPSTRRPARAAAPPLRRQRLLLHSPHRRPRCPAPHAQALPPLASSPSAAAAVAAASAWRVAAASSGRAARQAAAEGRGRERPAARRWGNEQDDRRYGYDYGGPGGRGGCGDERGQGQGMNHAPGSENPRREGMMSYKQFIHELEDDVSPVEAQCRYKDYKSEYIRTQKKAYFDVHKEEDWLKNKYHPTNLESVVERRNELARNTAEEFFIDLRSGSLDVIGPGLMNSAAHISGNESYDTLDDILGLNVKSGRQGKVSSEAHRIRVDSEQAQALICKLDAEKGIENTVLCGSDDNKSDGEKLNGSTGPIVIVRSASKVLNLEGVELLDTLITYLWRVHGVDYFGMSDTNEPKGMWHVKADSRTYNGTTASAMEWEKKLDSFWQDRLQGQDPLERLKAKDKIEAASTEVLDPYVRKIRDEKYGWKYGCGAKGCTKLFHAPEFVLKHLKLKHPDLVLDLTSKVREDIYFENYMNDPNARGGTPIMQQPTPMETSRQRPPMDSRLRDERGNRTDNDRFSKDILAPPVLMPVPGAGPLGPFVPAPPEVAMRMMREQGGPPPFQPAAGPSPRKAGRGGGLPMSGPSPIPNVCPPFQPNAGPRPRKAGRGGGLPMSGPSPILNVRPPLPHDPRRIRSYQDLDAPEDEVMVMDYRSL